MLCYDVEGQVGCLFSQSAHSVFVLLVTGQGTHFKILVDFFGTDTEDFPWLYASGVEEYDFYVFALGHAVELLEYVGDTLCVCQIDAECVDFDGYYYCVYSSIIDFDGGGAPTDKGRIYVLEALCIAR